LGEEHKELTAAETNSPKRKKREAAREAIMVMLFVDAVVGVIVAAREDA
jgi:hypothetical protein